MGYYTPVDFVNGAKLTRAQKDQIVGLNAAKLAGACGRRRSNCHGATGSSRERSNSRGNKSSFWNPR